MLSEKRIKVLHIITRLDPGGSAENTVLSVEKVDPERFDSYVWTGKGLDGEGPPVEYRKRLGKKLDVIPYLVRNISPVSDLLAIVDLATRIQKLRPDIVHLHSAKAGVVGRVAAKLAFRKTKVIYTPHGHVFSGYGNSISNRIFTSIEKIFASWCNAIVGLTNDELAAFKKHKAGKIEQFCVIPSGVNLDPYLNSIEMRDEARKEFGYKNDTAVVGYVGRFEEVKGPDLFVDVAKKISDRAPETRFLMVGEGSMRRDVVKKINDLNLNDKIKLPGWRKDIPRLFRAMDIYVLTSRNEGQGRVLVEAMATELATVGFDSGGVREVVDSGISGVVIKDQDIDKIADVVVKLLNAPERRKEMGEAGKERAEKYYSLDVMIHRLEKLYSGLKENRKPSEIFDK